MRVLKCEILFPGAMKVYRKYPKATELFLERGTEIVK